MARIRSIKPEFWTSEQVMDLSPNARLLFIGLWNFCDDAGIHPASTKRLKAEVMPADDVRSDDVRRLIDECINVGLVHEYEIDGEPYWAVTGWHHQKIDQPSYKYPKEDGTVPEGPARRRQAGKKPAANVHSEEVFAERSPPEGKGKERKEQEQDQNQKQELHPRRPSPDLPARNDDDGGAPVLGEQDLPDWVPRPIWREFYRHRAVIRKPLSIPGQRQVVQRLTELREQRHDIAKSLAQTIGAGLAIPVIPKDHDHAERPSGRHLSAVERVKANNDRADERDRLGGIGHDG